VDTDRFKITWLEFGVEVRVVDSVAEVPESLESNGSDGLIMSDRVLTSSTRERQFLTHGGVFAPGRAWLRAKLAKNMPSPTQEPSPQMPR
jgi:hypothetical protein